MLAGRLFTFLETIKYHANSVSFRRIKLRTFVNNPDVTRDNLILQITWKTSVSVSDQRHTPKTYRINTCRKTMKIFRAAKR